MENKLVALLDFDRLRLIKELLRNRTKIVWCIRLQRARDDDESARIEVGSGLMKWRLKMWRGMGNSGDQDVERKS